MWWADIGSKMTPNLICKFEADLFILLVYGTADEHHDPCLLILVLAMLQGQLQHE